MDCKLPTGLDDLRAVVLGSPWPQVPWPRTERQEAGPERGAFMTRFCGCDIPGIDAQMQHQQQTKKKTQTPSGNTQQRK